jgi:D-alanyl-D-alanine carboxypeptidase/D-alanyl-D-alanine-endopeptidase (penicillin-binding protein 4)
MTIKFSWSITICFLIAGCASQHEYLYDTKPAFYSFIMGDVDSPHITTEHAADVSVTPASCQKIITSLLAYRSLGKDYRFETKAYVTRQKGAIQDVIIEGSGDPTLTSANLKSLLEPIRGKTIQGKIVIDASLFHTPDYSRNIMVDDVGRPFAPPISAFNLDQNLIEVTVHPTQLGKMPLIHNDAGYQSYRHPEAG